MDPDPINTIITKTKSDNGWACYQDFFIINNFDKNVEYKEIAKLEPNDLIIILSFSNPGQWEIWDLQDFPKQLPGGGWDLKINAYREEKLILNGTYIQVLRRKRTPIIIRLKYFYEQNKYWLSHAINFAVGYLCNIISFLFQGLFK